MCGCIQLCDYTYSVCVPDDDGKMRRGPMAKYGSCISRYLHHFSFNDHYLISKNFSSKWECFFIYTGKPAAVTSATINATAVRLSWSGSVYFSTCVQYTVYYTSTTIIRQYERVYPPGVSSAVITLDSEILLTSVYVHKFRLYYITTNDIIPFIPGLTPHSTATFSFGNHDNVYTFHKVCG